MTEPIRTRGIQPDVPPATPEYKCPVCGEKIKTRAAWIHATDVVDTPHLGIGRGDGKRIRGCAACRNRS